MSNINKTFHETQWVSHCPHSLCISYSKRVMGNLVLRKQNYLIITQKEFLIVPVEQKK